MERMQTAVAWLMRVGVMVALLLVATGGVVYLYHHGHDVMNYHVFHGEPKKATAMVEILQAGLTLSPRALIQLGVLVLIITQILRVALMAWIFMRMRDYKFTLISTFILVTVVGVFFGIL